MLDDDLARICEDLRGALATAAANWKIQGGERCPACGALGRTARDGACHDDGQVLHDCECIFAVLPDAIEELAAIAARARAPDRER